MVALALTEMGWIAITGMGLTALLALLGFGFAITRNQVRITADLRWLKQSFDHHVLTTDKRFASRDERLDRVEKEISVLRERAGGAKPA